MNEQPIVWEVRKRASLFTPSRFSVYVVPNSKGLVALLARIFDADTLLTIMERAAHVSLWAERQATHIREALTGFETADC